VIDFINACRLSSFSNNSSNLQNLSPGLPPVPTSIISNPISPDPIEAKEADETLRKTIRLANLLDVPVVNTFSGIAS
jgi:sugar phosphate isomerase/epimerase